MSMGIQAQFVLLHRLSHKIYSTAHRLFCTIVAQPKMQRGEKRKKFHEALLSLYHPSSPPPLPPEPTQTPQLDEEPLVTTLCDNMDPDFDPVVDDVDKENSEGETSNRMPQKLSRAQRKRIRKRKLKEAASVRRNIIGPLFPSGYEDHKDEPCDNQLEMLQDKFDNVEQKLIQDYRAR